MNESKTQKTIMFQERVIRLTVTRAYGCVINIQAQDCNSYRTLLMGYPERNHIANWVQTITNRKKCLTDYKTYTHSSTHLLWMISIKTDRLLSQPQGLKLFKQIIIFLEKK